MAQDFPRVPFSFSLNMKSLDQLFIVISIVYDTKRLNGMYCTLQSL